MITKLGEIQTNPFLMFNNVNKRNMRTISDNALSIPTFSVDDIKDDSIAVEDKPIIERLVNNMVLIENGAIFTNY